MGCTTSNMNRQRSLRKGTRNKSPCRKPIQAISVVGVFLQKSHSMRLIRSHSRLNTSRSLHKRQASESLGHTSRTEGPHFSYKRQASKGMSHGWRQNGKEEEDFEVGAEIEVSDSPSSIEVYRFFPTAPLLESPPKICIEQERRLRCANMEGPLSGLRDLSSDEDDDEGDGFEFAKVETARIESFNSESGHIWTPITRLDSEQSIKKAPSLGALLDVPHSPQSVALTTDTLLSEQLESPLLEPEFQLLISPDYMPSLSDSDSQSTLLSPTSVCSSFQVPPCSPSLEQDFPSNSVNQHIDMSSASDDSLYFPGFTTNTPRDCGSVSPLSASYSESCVEYSPGSDGLGVHICKWVHPSPSWGYERPFETTPFRNLFDCHRSFDDAHGSRFVHPSPSPSKSVHVRDDASVSELLIPGLPNELAQLCLMRVPFIKYNQSYRMVCRQWREVLSSEEFYKTRSALGIHEAHLSLVVHGNRLRIFSLLAHQWFCLPPLPHEEGKVSPESRVSVEWSQSPGSQSSPRREIVPDWGIDPYDWWQIDTVTVSDGTLFVIGGVKAEIHSLTRPSVPTNQVHKYDFCRNCWVAVTPMKVPRSHAAAVPFGKSLYVAGGSDDIDEGASAEVYDCQQNAWSMLPKMNTSMRTCVGLEHEGCVFVKGESLVPGYHVEGEFFNPKQGRWERVSPGMRKGLERGPMASCGPFLFVADWKDSLLKVYDQRMDSWEVLSSLPARFSRLVGHSLQLFGLTGKIKVDPYNHQVISDAPAEVWGLDISKIMNGFLRQVAEVRLGSHLDGVRVSSDEGSPGSLSSESGWVCLWRDSKQMVKTGGLAWVPCIAHCTLFED